MQRGIGFQPVRESLTGWKPIPRLRIVEFLLWFAYHVGMDEQNSSAPIAPFFRSFRVVAGGYALSLVGLFGTGLLLLATVYPESFAICTSPDIEVFKSALENDPRKILPLQFMFIMLAVNALVCFVVGYLVARLAPFKKFVHGVFVAVILFVGFLQWTIGMREDTLQQILMLFMITAPVCVLFGVKFCLGRAEEDEVKDADDFGD